MRRRQSLSPGLFTGGAVVLPQQNTSPYMRYMMQMQMHQQSRENALAQYYSKIQTGINPAGVRSVDMEGWRKKVEDWQQYGEQHRDALVNPRLDGGRAQTEFQQMHTDLLGDVAKSKEAGANEMLVKRTFDLDPKKRMLASNNDSTAINSMSKSIYDTGHYKSDGVTPYSPNDLSFNAPPFDLNKQAALRRNLTAGLKLDKIPDLKNKTIDTAAQRVIVPYKQSYSPAAMQEIGRRAGAAYDGDPSMQAYYDNKIHDPDTYEKLNQAGKSVYGQDFDIGMDGRKAASAEAILNNSAIQQGNDSYHWQRPAQGRPPSQRQQAIQDMTDWVNNMSAAVKSGNVNDMKRLGGVLYSGNGKSQYQDIDYGPNQLGVSNDPGQIKNMATISHVDKQWVSDNDPKDPKAGSYKDVLNKDLLDPNDPQLPAKLVKVYQNHMGSTPGAENIILHQTVKPGAVPVSTPVATPNPDDLLNQYLPAK